MYLWDLCMAAYNQCSVCATASDIDFTSPVLKTSKDSEEMGYESTASCSSPCRTPKPTNAKLMDLRILRQAVSCSRLLQWLQTNMWEGYSSPSTDWQFQGEHLAGYTDLLIKYEKIRIPYTGKFSWEKIFAMSPIDCHSRKYSPQTFPQKFQF